MLKISAPLWNFFPFLKLIQYPWRLLVVIIFVSPILAVYIISRYKRFGLLFTFGMLFLMFVNNRNYMRPLEIERHNDFYYTKDVPLFYGSTDINWESLLVDITYPPSFFDMHSVNFTYQKNTEKEEQVKERLFFFPSWKIKVNGKNIPIRNDGGFISYTLPKGKNTVVIYPGQSNIQQFGNALTVCSMCILIGLSLKR